MERIFDFSFKDGFKDGRSMHILCVEDDLDDYDLFKRNLYASLRKDYDLMQVESIGKAKNHISNHPIDLVVLDLNLPDSTGLDSLKKIRGHSPEVAILVMTAEGHDEMGEMAIELGAQDYLPKNEMTPSSVSRAVRHAVLRQYRSN